MNARPLMGLLLVSACLSTLGCGSSGPTLDDLRKEQQRVAEAEKKVEAERQKAEAERQLREEESKKHDSEKSKLWMYVLAIAIIGVVGFFVAIGIGSAARKDSESEGVAHGN